jgi:hypothetical protein
MASASRETWLAAAGEYCKSAEESREREVLVLEMRQRTQAARGG